VVIFFIYGSFNEAFFNNAYTVSNSMMI